MFATDIIWREMQFITSMHLIVSLNMQSIHEIF